MMRILSRIMPWLAQRRTVAFVVGLGAFLLIALIDYVTPEEVSFSLFYLLPIALFLWVFGSRWAWAVSVASIIVWPSEHIVAGDGQYFRSLIPYWEAGVRLGFYAVFVISLSAIKRYVDQLHNTNDELNAAISEIKQLRGLLPMCSSCKKIRDDSNEWVVLEKYIQTHSDATISHGMCPECMQKMYPDIYSKISKKKADQ